MRFNRLASVRDGRFRRPAASLLLCSLAALPLARAQNILNNPGFEYGSMCYTWWTTSTTGNDFVGDYRYSLSTTSHSGNYSFQIACLPGGTDCARAELISTLIPVTPNQSYLFNAWVQCAAGYSGILAAADNVGAGNTTPVTCNGTWTQATMTFQPASTATGFSVYVVNEGAPSMLIDDLVVTFGDGTAPVRTTLHPGNRQVSISGNKVLVDGAPYLALGFYGVNRVDIPAVAATGANTINAVGGVSADCSNYGSKSFLDTAYEANLNVLPDSSSSTVTSTDAVFPSILQNFGPHLANIGWGLASEPDLYQLPAYNFVAPSQLVADRTAAITQTQLPMVNLMQHATYSPSDDVAYSPATDVWMAEPFGVNFSLVQSAASALTAISPKPLWLAEDDPGPSLVVPKAYWSIVNGATGIIYWSWPAFNQDLPSLASVEQVFSELTTLKGAIFGSPMDILVTPPSGVTTMSRFNQGTAYILAVNPNFATAGGKFTVQGLTAGQTVSVMFENRSLTATASGFTDSFSGIGRHVYAITSPSTTLASSITNKTGTAPARAWTIQAVDSGLGAATGAVVSNVQFSQGANSGTACTPSVAGGTFPLALGTITPGGTATGNLNVDFTGCDATSKFTVVVSLSANGGSTTAKTSFANQRY